MYNGFTDSQSNITPDNEGIEMNIDDIKTNMHVQSYFGKLIKEAEKKFGFCPTCPDSRSTWKKNVLNNVITSACSDLGAYGTFDIKKAKNDFSASVTSAVWYAEYFMHLGIFGKVKANNNLRDFGKMHSVFAGQFNYNSITGDPVRMFNDSASSESKFIGMVYKEVALIARLGAKGLSGNDKAKYPIHVGNAACRGSAQVEAIVLHENKIRFIVHGMGAPAITTGRQLYHAFSKMGVVETVTATKGSTKYIIEVTIRPEYLCGYKVKTSNVFTPVEVAQVIKKSSSVESVLQKAMAELQKEKDSLNERKAELNKEVTAISARVIQIGRQLSSLNASLEVMKEAPATGMPQ